MEVAVKKFTVDGHVDTISNYFQKQEYDFSKENPSFHVDLPRLKKANIGLQIFAIFVKRKYLSEQCLKITIKMIDKFHQLINESNKLELVTSYKDIEKITDDNKIGALLAIEGGNSIFDISALRIFYYLGVRLVTLTWNNNNQLATGINNQKQKSPSGLTKLGKKIVNKMNKLKMIIDVSHLSLESFWDVIDLSQRPVVASHSNARSICNHPRNLSDHQIKALANKKGLIGINFFPAFLNNSGQAAISDILRHIDYIREKVGITHIGLGTDYDGINNTPKGLSDIGKLPKLKKALSHHSYNQKDIQAIFQNNWLNLLREVLEA